MTKELTKAFERPLLFFLVVTFQGFVVGFFGFTPLFFRSELNSFLNYVSALSFLFVAVGNLSRMLCYYLMGQKLVDAYDATQNELGRLKYEAAGFELGEEDLRIIEELMRSIDVSKKIRPLKAVSLTHAGFTEMVTVLVTMIIVMLQFRISES